RHRSLRLSTDCVHEIDDADDLKQVVLHAAPVCSVRAIATPSIHRSRPVLRGLPARSNAITRFVPSLFLRGAPDQRDTHRQHRSIDPEDASLIGLAVKPRRLVPASMRIAAPSEPAMRSDAAAVTATNASGELVPDSLIVGAPAWPRNQPTP